jgi:hypothetical protein
LMLMTLYHSLQLVSVTLNITNSVAVGSPPFVGVGKF